MEAVKRIGRSCIEMRGHKRTTEYQARFREPGDISKSLEEKSPEAWLLGRLAHLEKNDDRNLILELILKEVEVLKAKGTPC